MDRRRALRWGLASALGAGLGLGSGSARACEFFTRTLRVTHPWARATLLDETSAVVCMKFDEVLQDDRLIGVQTMLATAAAIGHGRRTDADELPRSGVDLFIPKGQTTVLTEEGTHLRLLDLQWQLQVARAYPLDLIFEKGGRVQALLTIDFLRAG